MIRMISGLAVGLVFGLGLIVSSMIDPRKIMAFLDVAGAWDPSLALVMGAAVLVTLAGYRLTRHMQRPLLSSQFAMPTASQVDGRLLGGAALFGVGWGMTGYCPAPAITALSLGESGTVVFVVAMLAGMLVARWFRSSRSAPGLHEATRS